MNSPTPAATMKTTDQSIRLNMNQPMSWLVADETYLLNVGDTAPTISLIADAVSDM